MLVVEFTSGQFIGSESSQYMEIVVGIREGTSAFPVIVTVTSSVQSPVSARGKHLFEIINHHIPLGSGIDFNSDPLNITIKAGATSGRANVSVTCDSVVEGPETFNMRLTLTSTSHRITSGIDISQGLINDSTGK